MEHGLTDQTEPRIAPESSPATYDVPHPTEAMSHLIPVHEAMDPDVEKAVLLSSIALSHRPPGHPDRPLYLNDLAVALNRRYKLSYSPSDLHQVVSLHEEALQGRPPGDPARGDSINNLGVALTYLFQHEGRQEDLERAIRLFEESVEIHHPPGHEYHRSSMSKLANALRLRVESAPGGHGMQNDVTKMVDLYAECLALCAPGDPERGQYLNDLAGAVACRFGLTRNAGDLDRMLSLLHEALGLLPTGHPDRGSLLNNLASALNMRYSVTHSAEDLDRIVQLMEEALGTSPPGHPARGNHLQHLAVALSTRYEVTRTQEDLDRMIGFYGEVLDDMPLRHPNRLNTLFRLAEALSQRYNSRHSREDMGWMIRTFEQALELCPSGHSYHETSMGALCGALQHRYKVAPTDEDLDRVIQLQSMELESRPPGHPNRVTSLRNLAESLRSRYDKTSILEDLDTMIQLHEEVVELRPSGHPEHERCLAALVDVLPFRYQVTGTQHDLDEMLRLQTEMLRLRPLGHPHRGRSLNDMAMALACRHDVTGSPDDLESIIRLLSEALELYAPRDPERRHALSNLANAFFNRYERTGAEEDVERMVALHEEALELHPIGHPNRWLFINNLAASLAHRHHLTKDEDDLHRILELCSQSLDLQPPNHPSRSTALTNLANALSRQYQRNGTREDLERILQLRSEALDLCAVSHPDRSGYLGTLADTLRVRHGLTAYRGDLIRMVDLRREAKILCPPGHPNHAERAGDLAEVLTMVPPYDVEEVIRLARDGALDLVSPAAKSLHCTRLWVQAAQLNHHASLEDAYTHSIQFLRYYLTVGATVKHQYDALQRQPELLSLPMDAAAHAIEKGKVEEAVEILDAGRSLLWSEMRRFRDPLDQQSRERMGEKLANDFVHSCYELQKIATAEASFDRYPVTHHGPGPGEGLAQMAGGTAIPYDVLLPRKRKLLQDHQVLLEKIRARPGMEHFQLRRPFESLQAAAQGGPVIIINCSRHGSHVIIVFHDKPPIVIPLDDGDEKDEFHTFATEVHQDYLDARGELDSNSSQDRSQTFGRKLNPVLQRMWRLVGEKVVDALKPILPIGSRIWWCPTSFLTILPFHAAGTTKQSFLDYYISSYTPTLQALIDARRPHPNSSPATTKGHPTEEDPNPRILVIAKMDSQDGFSELSSGADEFRVLQNLGSSVSSLEGPQATSSHVLEGLSTHSWAHFICHGTLHPRPFESSLHLHGGDRLTLNDIIKAYLPSAQFAFLAACHTAEQGSRLQDEVLHLAAAMQFSGFQSVIGTMWAMRDSDGPEVAREFYKRMLGDSLRARCSFAVLKKLAWVLPPFVEQTLQRWAGLGEEGKVLSRHERAARAIWEVTRKMRKEGKELERWINFVHIGA